MGPSTGQRTMGLTHFQETERRLSADKLVMGVATAPEYWGEL